MNFPENILDLDLFEFAKCATQYFDESHDYQHAHNVFINSFVLLHNYADCLNSLDEKLLMFCAMLHDVIDHKYQKLNKSIPRELLRSYIERHFDLPDTKRFFEVIDNISYSKQKNKLPQNKDLIYMIVSDADKLEALGNSGIKRCYNFAKILHPEADEKQLTQYVIEHCHEKLLTLHEYLYLDHAKELAKPLTQELWDYVNAKKES